MWWNYCLAVLSFLGPKQASESALQNINQDGIIQKIMCYAINQRYPETRFEHFKELMKYRRVSKQWKTCSQLIYNRLLQEEKEMVESWYEYDFTKIREEKEPLVITPADDYAKQICCMIKYNMLVVLHDTLQEYPEYATQALCTIDCFSHRHPVIYPLTWAVYMDASAATQLLTKLFKKNAVIQYEIEQQYKTAQIFKISFDRVGRRAMILDHLPEHTFGRDKLEAFFQ